MRLIDARPPRHVDRFDLITPTGRTYRYPQPNWFDRAAARLCSIAEPAIRRQLCSALRIRSVCLPVRWTAYI